MRLSELLGKPVWHETGRSLGTVHDVRAEQVAAFGNPAPLRVTGIAAGRSSIGVRLGYGTAELRGPWLLQLIFGTLARHARYIAWDQLRIEPDRIVVTAPLDTLRHPSDLEGAG